jgi:hypothetical protein
MREVMIEVPKVKWTDIGGQAIVQSRLREAIELPLKVKFTIFFFVFVSIDQFFLFSLLNYEAVVLCIFFCFVCCELNSSRSFLFDAAS